MKNLANEYALWALIQPFFLKKLEEVKKSFDNYDRYIKTRHSVKMYANLSPENKALEHFFF